MNFFVDIVPFDVMGSGFLVSGACRAMEGDGGYNLAMGGRQYRTF